MSDSEPTIHKFVEKYKNKPYTKEVGDALIHSAAYHSSQLEKLLEKTDDWKTPLDIFHKNFWSTLHSLLDESQAVKEDKFIVTHCDVQYDETTKEVTIEVVIVPIKVDKIHIKSVDFKI